jgi:hypothetical protein
MAQNKSHAVMAQRIEPADSLDDFPTQPWATRALIENIVLPHIDPAGLGLMRHLSAWEPCCNRGHMALPMKEYFGRVFCSDIFDYGWAGQDHRCDFLIPELTPREIAENGADWVFLNPPFRLAEQFIERSFSVPKWQGTAAVVRSSFTEGVGRYERLFSVNPPDIVAQFVERVPMVKGRLIKNGSTATAYAWLVWFSGGDRDTRYRWIPPCRKRLERPNDYPQAQIDVEEFIALAD